MKSEMVTCIALMSLALVALMNPAVANGQPVGQMPREIQNNMAPGQQYETHPSKNASSAASVNRNDEDQDDVQIAASLNAALQLEQLSNPLKTDMMTPRARRSYKLPGNLDLTQFYTPQGIYDVTSAEDRNEMMTKKELEYEREKFLRLLSILESVQAAGSGGDRDDASNADGAPEPVIALMSNHPSRNKGWSIHSNGNPATLTINTSGQNDDDPDWLDDPIPIHRHRAVRRAHNEAGGEDEYYGYDNPRQMYKRVPEFVEYRKDKTPVYSLSQLFSKAQKQDTRYPLRHRFLL